MCVVYVCSAFFYLTPWVAPPRVGAARTMSATEEEGWELAAPFMVPSFSAAVWIKEQRSRGADLAVCRRDLGRHHRALNEELSSLLQARGTQAQ